MGEGKIGIANLLLALFSLVLVNCDGSDEIVTEDKMAVPMSAHFTNSRLDVSSRELVTDDLITSGTIGVTLLDAEGNDYDGKSQYRNIKYTTDDGTSWTPGSTAYLTSTEGKAVAYYPFVDGAVDPTSIPVDATKQQDVVYSKWVEGLSNLNSRAEFHMEHALAAVRVIVKKDANFSSDVTLTDVTIQSDGFYESAILDATTGDLKDLQTEGASFSVTAIDKLLDTGGQTVDFTVIPGTTAKDISFMVTAGGNRYHSSFTPAGPLARGFIHTFTLVLTAEEAVLDGVSVTPWQELKQDPDYMDFYDEYYQNGIICTYYTTTEGSLNVAYSVSGISKMMVDGVEVTPATSVNVTAGEHVVKYLFNKVNDEYVIPSAALRETTKLKSVYISKGITKIGTYAFYGCTGVTSVDFTDCCELEIIGDYAFYQNKNLKKVDLGCCNKLKKIGESIQYFKSPNESITYRAYVFYECTALSKIIFPESLEQIGTGAFNGCRELVEIDIPASVSNIGMSAFGSCRKIKSIDLSKCTSLKFIANHLFNNCSELSSIILPTSVTDIGDMAFSQTAIVSIDLSSYTNLTRLGYTINSYTSHNSGTSMVGVFYGCEELEEVKLPESITILGATFCAYCPKLRTINIPAKVSTIGNNCFSDAENLQIDLDLSENMSLTSIGRCAFESSGIKKLILPPALKTIEYEAFFNCKELEGELVIPNTVTTISNRAFDDTYNLKSLIIGSKVSSIGSKAFSGNLESITVVPENTTYDSRNNCNAIMRTSTNTLILGCNNTIIPDDCTSIGEYAFYNSNGYTELTIPANCTSIGKDAFDLSNVRLIKMKTTTPPTQDNSFIDSYDNGNNYGLLIVPVGCKDSYNSWIGNNGWLVIEEGDYIYENGLYYDTTGKTLIGCAGSISGAVSIKDGVETIRGGALYSANKITSLTIPNSVITINKESFHGCHALVELYLGSNLQMIKEDAFEELLSLEKIVIHATTPPTIYNWTFRKLKKNGIIYVPKGCLAEYVNSYWYKDTYLSPGYYGWTFLEM